MSISGSLARPDLLLPNRRLADTTLLASGLRPLALPDVDWMGALRQATSSFNVTLVYDVYENFFGTDLVDPVDGGGILEKTSRRELISSLHDMMNDTIIRTTDIQYVMKKRAACLCCTCRPSAYSSA